MDSPKDDFYKYEAMQRRGESAEGVYNTAVADGLDAFARIRMLRSVFGLTFGEVKEVNLRAEAIDPEEHFEKVGAALDKALEDDTQQDIQP